MYLQNSGKFHYGACVCVCGGGGALPLPPYGFATEDASRDGL